MEKRIIDGVTYVPQEDMQRAFEERLQKVTAARITAEDRSAQLESDLDAATGRLGTLETLNSRISELESNLLISDPRWNGRTTAPWRHCRRRITFRCPTGCRRSVMTPIPLPSCCGRIWSRRPPSLQSLQPGKHPRQLRRRWTHPPCCRRGRTQGPAPRPSRPPA